MNLLLDVTRNPVSRLEIRRPPPLLLEILQTTRFLRTTTRWPLHPTVLPTPRATTTAARRPLLMTCVERASIPSVAPGLSVVARLLSSRSPGPPTAVTSRASVRCRLLESSFMWVAR